MAAEPAKAKLKPVKKYRLMPGHAGIYQDGTITPSTIPTAHVSSAHRHQSRQDPRVRFDLATGEVHQMTRNKRRSSSAAAWLGGFETRPCKQTCDLHAT